MNTPLHFDNTLRRVCAFLWAFCSRYAGQDLLLEIRPLWPEFMKEILYPNGDGPYFWRSKTGQRRYFRSSEVERAARHCLRCAGRFDTYFGVLPRTERIIVEDGAPKKVRRGSTEFVPQAACLFADVDGGAEGVEGAVKRVKEAVRRGLPPPNVVVISGNGLHVYWFLSDVVEFASAEDRRRFKELLQRLVRFIGGPSAVAHADKSVAEVARILRVPYTWNWKRREEPRAVRLLRFQPDAEAKSVAWWGSFLPALPAPPERKKTLPDWDHADANAIQRYVKWAQRGYPEGNRHRDLASAAAWLAREQRLPADVVEDLLAVKAAASPGLRTITDDEIASLVQWGLR